MEVWWSRNVRACVERMAPREDHFALVLSDELEKFLKIFLVVNAYFAKSSANLPLELERDRQRDMSDREMWLQVRPRALTDFSREPLA